MSENDWVYSVWFSDLPANPDDQDKEWVALLRIRAESDAAAQEWGDHLAKVRVAQDPASTFLWSEVREPTDPMYESTRSWDSVPTVEYGEEPSDEDLAW